MVCSMHMNRPLVALAFRRLRCLVTEKGFAGYEDIVTFIERAIELMRSEGAVR